MKLTVCYKIRLTLLVPYLSTRRHISEENLLKLKLTAHKLLSAVYFLAVLFSRSPVTHSSAYIYQRLGKLLQTTANYKTQFLTKIIPIALC